MEEPNAPRFTIEEILNDVRFGTKRRVVTEIPGAPVVKLWQSIRLRVFAKKGTVCVKCGRAGAHFALEYKSNSTPHLNLYTEDGVLMTMDHIRPRSKGGAHNLTNLQPMCEPCNAQKSDSWVEAA